MAIDANVLSSLGAKTTADTNASTTKRNQLGQAEFLKLMTTQMTHQDPMKPMENGEFITQMAQFGTVSGIQDLQASFKDFSTSISSNQALQAAGLVGRYVSAPSKEALLSAGGSVSGDFELSSSSPNVKVKITDTKTGETIRELDLGEHSAGKVAFEWDGKADDGTLADPGVYKVEASALIDGKTTAQAVNINSLVKSVTMGNGGTGMQVELLGLGSVKFNDIKKIL